MRRQQRQAVRGGEREQDQVGARPAAECDDDPGGRHEHDRAERLPEAQAERERRRRVVLEAEPAVLRELLDAVEVAQAAPAWITTNGLVTTNAAAASPTEIPTRRHAPKPATTIGTTRTAPGYFADAASPAATPAHSSRPETSSASVAVTPSVRSTSVTAIREYAACVVATATPTAPVIPAAVPYATRPSHQAAATPSTPTSTATTRAAPYEGSSRPIWVGARTRKIRLG